MSIIHVNQIKGAVKRLFDKKIDMSDISQSEQYENFSLTRGLAAYSLYYLTQSSVDSVAMSITDGGNDNGIDAIYYDERDKILYLVQSKWIHNGLGEPENGEIKKFTSGVRDLFNQNFDRFNDKVTKKIEIINNALSDPSTKYEVVLAYTGINDLSQISKRDFTDLADEINDASEILSYEILNQSRLHRSLAIGLSGEPISLDVGISSWGRVEAPYKAFYGQIRAKEIFDWWNKYRSRLFIKNLRSVIGDTDVNNEIRETIEKNPQFFWYFNNGLTLVANKIQKTGVGSGSTDFGIFHCEDVNVVNGAQTVGAIGKSGEKVYENLKDVLVPIRIISLEGSDPGFGELVTKTNNRQNKIENRDFVNLDSEQNRIKMELAIDEINYNVMRTESFVRSEKSFDLVEATTALSCASTRMNVVVQLKREIGKLWDDIDNPKSLYKGLFNPSVSGLFLYRCVLIQRMIDKNLEEAKKISGWKENSIFTHGNRFISSMIFNTIDPKRLKDPAFNFETHIQDSEIKSLAYKFNSNLKTNLDKYYSNAIIPTLFKNLKKCNHLAELSK